MKNLDLYDFFNKGFQIFDGSKYANQIDCSKIEWIYEGGVNNDYHPSNNVEEINSFLLSIHYQIAMDILEGRVDYTVEKRRLWEGVNKDATVWHNDLKEGPNCFFLLYHSDMMHDGFVHFRNRTQEFTVTPKKGLLVAVNCDTKFEHKATPSKQTRIISSYYFNIYDNT